MAWDDIITKLDCTGCGNSFRIRVKELWQADNNWVCPKCGTWKRLSSPPIPNLPQAIYIGSERLKRTKVIPLPPTYVLYEGVGEYHQWHGAGDCAYCPFVGVLPDSYGAPTDCGFHVPDQVQPYSVRSILIQLSLRKDFPCKYFVRAQGTDSFGNVLWEEGCMEHCGGCDYRSYLHPCNVVNGWMHGDESCAGWGYIKALCQSENEVRFLEQYLRINHDREYPMPIPQAYIEITERVRVDFLLFVPITRFEWKWLAVEIDSRQYHANHERDFKKTATIASEGYEVIRLPAEKKMLEQVRDLYSKLTEIQNAAKNWQFQK